MIDSIIQLRRKLHQNPELSGSEIQTATTIKNFIAHHHPTQILENLGGHGLAAVYTFSSSGPTVAIRCELDALPIEEANAFLHKSLVSGVAHKCGHDGHMAMVAGLVLWLKDQSFSSGKVVLLFQPAEETGQGAHAMLQDQRLKELAIDYCFALHNIPGTPMHEILALPSGFSAEVQSLAIYLKGKESHASEPENGINPTTGIAEIATALSKLNCHDPQDPEFSILTPVYINMGQKSYGISPAKGEIHYTIRTWTSAKMEQLQSNILEILQTICTKHQLDYRLDWFEHFPASQNDEHCNRLILETAQANHFKVREMPFPFKFGEDFGWFSNVYPSAMFGLGAGINTPALHHADYDFPDELLTTGIAMFKGIITRILS